MSLFASTLEKLKNFKKPALSIYPIVIIVSIPVLLIINTLWNIKSFNRDANFIVRHQAIGVAETLKPIVKDSLSDIDKLKALIASIVESHEDVIWAAILKDEEEGFSIYAESGDSPISNLETGLDELAKGFNQPVAGLVYDPNTRRDVWNVITPLVEDESGNYFLRVILDTKSISEILARTTKDSFLILIILVLVTIGLLANHFIFYIRSLRTQQLEELDRLKDEFISIAAHELRAPITALIGYLELLKDKISPQEVEKVRPDLELLNSLIGDLNTLINELLDVSRIEQGRFQVNLVDVNVNDCIGKVVRTILPQAEQKGLQVKFTPSDLPIIKSDPDRLRQIMMNLLSNSVKYTLKGEVNVVALLEGESIKVTVRDAGIGIPGEELAKLFTKFHRVKDEKTSEVRGTGLGLWITKRIVEILGGKINVESIYGTGTSVIFTLPLARDTA